LWQNRAMLTTQKPDAWWWYFGLEYDDLANVVNENALPVMLRSYFDRTDGNLKYAAILAKYPNDPVRWWYAGIPESEVGQLFQDNGAMPYSVQTAGSTYCTIMVPQDGAWWWWDRVSANDVTAHSNDDNAAVTWVSGFSIFQAVLSSPAPTTWWWPQVQPSDVGTNVSDVGGVILSAEPWWQQDTNEPLFTVLAGPDDGQPGWWYWGLTGDEVSARLEENNAYLVDLCPYFVWEGPQVFGHTQLVFSVVMRAF
jgi:hypothetical protein